MLRVRPQSLHRERTSQGANCIDEVDARIDKSGVNHLKNATIRDLKGEALAKVVLDERSEGPRLSVGRVTAGKGKLLGHYFGSGLRQVLLESGEFQFPAILSTDWKGESRQWFLELRAPEYAMEPIVRGQY